MEEGKILSKRFLLAAEEVKSLNSIPDEDKGRLYGLYKQAQVGDVNIAKPGFFELTAKAKWNAWDAQKGYIFGDF